MPSEAPGLPPGFALIAAGRLVSNIAFRLVFPFLPRIASGLGVSLGTMGTALAVREMVGFASPAVGRTTDRRARSTAMGVGMVGLAVAMVLSGASGGMVLFTVALVLTSLAKIVFDIGSSAWVGDSVPFSSRGRAIGMLETTWALSFVIGMPLAALAIRVGTWRTPFLLTAAACAVLAVGLRSLGTLGPPAETRAAKVTWTPVLRAAVAAMTLLGIGHQMILVTFASFLDDEHGLSVSALGLTAVVIGVAELAGSAGVTLAGDRVGKARGAAIAMIATVPLSLAIPLGGSALVVAMAILALWFAVIEYAIVSMLTLFSELDPRARARVLGVALAGWTGGHAAGSFAGAWAYEASGMTLTAVGVAVTFLGASLLTRVGVFDPDPDEDRLVESH